MIPFMAPMMMGAAGADPLAAFISRLMHMDGANGATVFPEAKVGASITRSGSVAISTAQSLFGGASALLSGGYLIGDLAMDWGTGDFFFELWAMPASTAASAVVFCRDTFSGNSFQLRLGTFSGAMTNQAFIGRGGVADDYSFPATFTVGVGSRLAVGRKNGTLYFWQDGVLKGTVSNATFDYGSNAIGHIGSNGGGAPGNLELFPGYVDELVVMKGYCPFTANYPLRTAPYAI